MTYRNPLYGCQHPFPNSAASVNIKLLLNIISLSFGPRTHELASVRLQMEESREALQKGEAKVDN